MIDDFYSTVAEGLREKLGCILFQLPPSYNYTDERLQNIISSLDHSFNNVIEFRHTTWWNKVVYDELAKKRITFCGMSHLLLPDEIIQNTQIVYHRMHGVPELYKSPYSIVELKKIIKVIKNSGSTKQAFIYFNNDIDGSAITNAKQMIELCEKKR